MKTSGFTLVEILIAISILLVVAFTVTNMANDMFASWEVGMRKSESNLAARSALDFMAREISQAIADDQIVIKISQNEIRCLASSDIATNEPSHRRTFHGANFTLTAPVSLVWNLNYEKVDDPDSNDWLTLGAAGGNCTLIENVYSLDFSVYSTYSELNNNTPVALPYNPNQLPYCVDVALRVLSRRDALRLPAMGAQAQDYADKNTRLYTTRIYFHNRQGYSR